MNRTIAVALIGAALLVLGPIGPALAQDAVVVPWGAWVADATWSAAGAVLALGAWLLRKLPRQVVEVIDTLRLGQLMARAVGYGLNATSGASRDKVLTIDVGNRVLAEALGYALRHGPGLVRRFLGDDPVLLAEKLWARLPMDEAASRPDFVALVEAVRAGWGEGAPAPIREPGRAIVVAPAPAAG